MPNNKRINLLVCPHVIDDSMRQVNLVVHADHVKAGLFIQTTSFVTRLVASLCDFPFETRVILVGKFEQFFQPPQGRKHHIGPSHCVIETSNTLAAGKPRIGVVFFLFPLNYTLLQSVIKTEKRTLSISLYFSPELFNITLFFKVSFAGYRDERTPILGFSDPYSSHPGPNTRPNSQ